MAQPLQAGVTRGAALKALRTLLAEAGIDDGAADARLLLCAAEGVGSLDLIRAPELALERGGAGAAGADGGAPRGGRAGVAHSVAAGVLGPAAGDIA